MAGVVSPRLTISASPRLRSFFPPAPGRFSGDTVTSQHLRAFLHFSAVTNRHLSPSQNVISANNDKGCHRVTTWQKTRLKDDRINQADSPVTSNTFSSCVKYCSGVSEAPTALKPVARGN